MFSSDEWRMIVLAALRRTELEQLTWTKQGESPMYLYVAELNGERAISIASRDHDDQAPYFLRIWDIATNHEPVAEIVTTELHDHYDEPFGGAERLYTLIQRQLTGVDAEFRRIMELLGEDPQGGPLPGR